MVIHCSNPSCSASLNTQWASEHEVRAVLRELRWTYVYFEDPTIHDMIVLCGRCTDEE